MSFRRKQNDVRQVPNPLLQEAADEGADQRGDEICRTEDVAPASDSGHPAPHRSLESSLNLSRGV